MALHGLNSRGQPGQLVRQEQLVRPVRQEQPAPPELVRAEFVNMSATRLPTAAVAAILGTVRPIRAATPFNTLERLMEFTSVFSANKRYLERLWLMLTKAQIYFVCVRL